MWTATFCTTIGGWEPSCGMVWIGWDKAAVCANGVDWCRASHVEVLAIVVANSGLTSFMVMFSGGKRRSSGNTSILSSKDGFTDCMLKVNKPRVCMTIIQVYKVTHNLGKWKHRIQTYLRAILIEIWAHTSVWRKRRRFGNSKIDHHCSSFLNSCRTKIISHVKNKEYCKRSCTSLYCVLGMSTWQYSLKAVRG